MTNGMKPGSGSDPFEDVNDNDRNDSEPDNRSEEIFGREEEEKEEDEVDETIESSSEGEQASPGLPFIYARDGVKTARDHTFQLHYQEETYQDEKQVQSTIENRLGEDVYKVDLREAAMLAAFDNVDDIENILRGWGYDAE